MFLDEDRDVSAIPFGTSGSTPLYFVMQNTFCTIALTFRLQVLNIFSEIIPQS